MYKDTPQSHSGIDLIMRKMFTGDCPPFADACSLPSFVSIRFLWNHASLYISSKCLFSSDNIRPEHQHNAIFKVVHPSSQNTVCFAMINSREHHVSPMHYDAGPYAFRVFRCGLRLSKHLLWIFVHIKVRTCFTFPWSRLLSYINEGLISYSFSWCRFLTSALDVIQSQMYLRVPAWFICQFGQILAYVLYI